jgi:tRNA G10  N-methylase Trm11
MQKPILNHLKPGELVFEPFCGSGTTLMAAETEGRVCYATELDPKYVDVIVRRWQKFTSEKAFLDGPDEPRVSFDQAMVDRDRTSTPSTIGATDEAAVVA